MASIILILLVLAFPIERAQPALAQNITSGLSISPKGNPDSWHSPSWHFAFGFYQEDHGFRLGIWILDGNSNKTVVWTANRDDPPVSANATLVLGNDGKLSLAEDGQTKSIVGDLDKPIDSAFMLDNGNFVLKSSENETIWQSFDHPTDTILAGQSLLSSLYSSVSRTSHTPGRFQLTLSGNRLLLTPVEAADDYYWWTFALDEEVKLNLDDNGHMYLAMMNNTNLQNITYAWPSSSENLVIYRATLDQDGIFRLYSHRIHKNGSCGCSSKVDVKWQALEDKCSVNGICGINSYCKLVGGRIDCICLPGFDYTDSSERSAGCQMQWGDHNFGTVEEEGTTPSVLT